MAKSFLFKLARPLEVAASKMTDIPDDTEEFAAVKDFFEIFGKWLTMRQENHDSVSFPFVGGDIPVGKNRTYWQYQRHPITSEAAIPQPASSSLPRRFKRETPHP